MAYKTDVIVDVPNTDNIFINQGFYVQYFTGYHWDEKKKKSVDDRVCVGKLVVKNVKDKMYPNDTYYELLGGREKPLRVGNYLNVGPYYVLTLAAEKVGLLPSLRMAFPDLWEKIFASCVRIIDDECSDGQNFEYWGFHNYCGLSEPLSSSAVSKLHKAISQRPDAREEFKELFRKAFHEAIPGTDQRIMALDSTNFNTSCTNNRYAERGKAKIDKNLPITNLALMTDEMTGITLDYEIYYGSILDKRETPRTVEKFRELGYTKCHLALDSGYASKDSIESFGDGVTFSVMIPQNFNAYEEMFLKYGDRLRGIQENYIASEDAYGIKKESIHIFNGIYYGYLFYDRQMAVQEENNLHEMIASLKSAANERKRYTPKMAKQFSAWLDIRKEYDPNTGKDFKVYEKTDKIQEALNEAGFFMVASDFDTTAEEMLSITRKRDKSEKANRRIKSTFDYTAAYTHNTDTFEGKTFIEVLSQMICESYSWYIRSYLRSSDPNTVQTSLGEMRKYMMKKKKDGTWMPVYATTKKQNTILALLDTDQSAIDQWIRSIAL